jgi:hypothetical protein
VAFTYDNLLNQLLRDYLNRRLLAKSNEHNNERIVDLKLKEVNDYFYNQTFKALVFNVDVETTKSAASINLEVLFAFKYKNSIHRTNEPNELIQQKFKRLDFTELNKNHLSDLLYVANRTQCDLKHFKLFDDSFLYIKTSSGFKIRENEFSNYQFIINEKDKITTLLAFKQVTRAPQVTVRMECFNPSGQLIKEQQLFIMPGYHGFLEHSISFNLELNSIGKEFKTVGIWRVNLIIEYADDDLNKEIKEDLVGIYEFFVHPSNFERYMKTEDTLGSRSDLNLIKNNLRHWRLDSVCINGDHSEISGGFSDSSYFKNCKQSPVFRWSSKYFSPHLFFNNEKLKV